MSITKIDMKLVQVLAFAALLIGLLSDTRAQEIDPYNAVYVDSSLIAYQVQGEEWYVPDTNENINLLELPDFVYGQVDTTKRHHLIVDGLAGYIDPKDIVQVIADRLMPD